MTNERRIDGWGAFLTAISPAFALVYLGVLTRKVRAVASGIRQDRATRTALLGMAAVGAVSAALAPDQVSAWATWLVPLLIIGFYALGRWGVVNPHTFLRAITLGCGFLGVIVIVSRLLELDLWIGDIPILAEFASTGQRGNVLGMANNGLAAMMEAGVTGGFGLALVQKRHRLLYALAGLASLIGIFNTYSRGSMVAVAAGLLLLLALHLNQLKRWWKPILVGVVLVGALLSSWPRLEGRIESILDFDRHVQRVRIWTGTLHMVLDHPLVGSGPGNFGTVYPEYRLPDEYEHARSPHNIYLFIVSGWGFIGFFIFFGWMAISVLRPLIQSPNAYRRIAFAMMAPFWVHVLVNDLFIAHVPLIMGCIAHASLTDDENVTESLRHTDTEMPVRST